MGFLPWLLLFASPAALGQQNFILDRFEFRGMRNVLHNDTQNHFAYKVASSNLAADWERVRNACASYCSLRDDCDAFYLEEKQAGNCHLVDESLPPATPRFVGHGWALDNMYYLKEDRSLDGPGAIPIPEELIPPCDLDDTELPQSDCSAFPSNMTTYYACPDSSAKYSDSVTLVPDHKCPTEDRMLQCELENREVLSNIADKSLFDDAFIKDVYQPKGFISNGPELTFVTMTFKSAPRELTRLVLRTIRSGNEHMKEGTIEVYKVGDTTPDVINYWFDKVEKCALMVNFNWPDAGYTRHSDAEKVTVRPTSWYGFDKHGFKIDLFIKEIVLAK